MTVCSLRCSKRLNDPEDDDDPRSDQEMDSDELRDYEDQDPHVPPTSTANFGPYNCFLHDLPDFINMAKEEYSGSVHHGVTGTSITYARTVTA
jgi:hypothetical protein